MAHTTRQLIPTMHVDCACRECTPHPLTRIAAIAEALPYPRAAQAVIDAAPSTLTETDWLEVAIAALDQCGLSLAQLRGYEAMLRAAFERRAVVS